MGTINKDDIVSVHFHGSKLTLCKNAIVLYVPCATGDSWHLRDLDTNDIHIISEGVTLTKKGTT